MMKKVVLFPFTVPELSRSPVEQSTAGSEHGRQMHKRTREMRRFTFEVKKPERVMTLLATLQARSVNATVDGHLRGTTVHNKTYSVSDAKGRLSDLDLASYQGKPITVLDDAVSTGAIVKELKKSPDNTKLQFTLI